MPKHTGGGLTDCQREIESAAEESRLLSPAARLVGVLSADWDEETVIRLLLSLTY
jgi:hypothetical protein